MIKRLFKPGDRGPTARELNKLIADSTSAHNVRASNGLVQQRRGGTIMHPRFQPITEFTGRIEDDDEYSTDARYRVVQLFAANHEEGTWSKHVEFKDLGEGLHVVATNMVEANEDDREAETHDIEVGTIVKVYALLDITEPQRMNRWVFWFGGGGGTITQAFTIDEQPTEEHLDHVVCRKWDAWEQKAQGKDVLVAKPELLRQTPYHQRMRKGIRYQYRTPWERTAFRGQEEEIQVVIPTYYINDIIYATMPIEGGTGVIVEVRGRPKKLDWLDDNRDSRAWLEKFEEGQ